ncbi:Rz1-like lysis system protein LysC, partial [Klebsiella pneumoniae]|uniref:Rz1-like lysis system protein LysC n=1 Tax=Klebsiella pneumoniae TaxID=573 RepID=UPI001F29161B
VTQCRLEKSVARTNGDLLTALDEAEAAWAVCADKVDTIISCQQHKQKVNLKMKIN